MTVPTVITQPQPTLVRRERIVWCCGASGWTRVIAWLQMIVCVTGTLAAFICIVGILRGNEISQSGWGIVGELIAIITHAGGAMMGYILLKGSQMANVEYLNMWIGYTVIAGIVYTVTFLGAGIISGGFFIFGMASVFYILVAWFCIWVVRLHAKEIREGIVCELITHV